MVVIYVTIGAMTMTIQKMVMEEVMGMAMVVIPMAVALMVAGMAVAMVEVGESNA